VLLDKANVPPLPATGAEAVVQFTVKSPAGVTDID